MIPWLSRPRHRRCAPPASPSSLSLNTSPPPCARCQTATLTYSHTDAVAITNALTTTDTVGRTVRPPARPQATSFGPCCG